METAKPNEQPQDNAALDRAVANQIMQGGKTAMAVNYLIKLNCTLDPEVKNLMEQGVQKISEANKLMTQAVSLFSEAFQRSLKIENSLFSVSEPGITDK